MNIILTCLHAENVKLSTSDLKGYLYWLWWTSNTEWCRAKPGYACIEGGRHQMAVSSSPSWWHSGQYDARWTKFHLQKIVQSYTAWRHANSTWSTELTRTVRSQYIPMYFAMDSFGGFEFDMGFESLLWEAALLSVARVSILFISVCSFSWEICCL